MVTLTTQGAPDASRPDPVVTHDEDPFRRLLGALGTASSWGLDRSDLQAHRDLTVWGGAAKLERLPRHRPRGCGVGARPLLENSTACRKSMPI